MLQARYDTHGTPRFEHSNSKIILKQKPCPLTTREQRPETTAFSFATFADYQVYNKLEMTTGQHSSLFFPLTFRVTLLFSPEQLIAIHGLLGFLQPVTLNRSETTFKRYIHGLGARDSIFFLDNNEQRYLRCSRLLSSLAGTGTRRSCTRRVRNSRPLCSPFPVCRIHYLSSPLRNGKGRRRTSRGWNTTPGRRLENARSVNKLRKTDPGGGKAKTSIRYAFVLVLFVYSIGPIPLTRNQWRRTRDRTRTKII